MKTGYLASFAALAVLAWCSPGHAQGRTDTAPFEIMETSIGDIHAAFRSGTLTSRRLVQRYLDRIAAYDKRGPTINSIITLNPEALAEADRLDAAYKSGGQVGPLHGIPVLVKDEIDTAGMPTTLGTLVFQNYRPTRDAFVVEKLKKAGAIMLGKTTLSEFAAGDTYGSMFGVTRNPYDSGANGRRFVWRFRRRAGGEFFHPGAWRRNLRLDPAAGGMECAGGATPDAGSRQPQRHVGWIPVPSGPDGADGPYGARPCDAARRHGGL